MKKTAIVTGGSSNDVAAMAVLVLNLKATNPDLADEVVIFHDGISKKDQRLINGILPTRFIRYAFPGKDDGTNPVITDYFTPMVFCKYECFRLLAEYRIVIWTDYDILIKDDLTELATTSATGIRIMCAPSASIRESFLPSISEEDMAGFDLSSAAIAMPLFVLDDSLANYEKYYEWCIAKTKQYWRHLHLPEQAIVSLLLQSFEVPISPLQGSYGTHPLHGSPEEIEGAKILHAYGQPKFWNGVDNADWNRYYRTWRTIGGSPYSSSAAKRTFLSLIKRFGQKAILGRIPGH